MGNAKITTGFGSGGTKRQMLKEILPLDVPLAIDIFPISACNFKCKFCVCSLPMSERGFDFKTNIMDMSLFQKCVDEMKLFPQKIKMLKFVGVGEPLLHKDIAKMVRYVVEADVAKKVEIITNGSLLTPQLADALIEAGLPQIRISVEALDDETYEEITDVKIRFQDIVDNITYLYEHKTNMHINVKIVDYAIKSEEQRERFYQKFSNICDSMSIECLAEASTRVDYSDMRNKIENRTMRGDIIDDVNICPQPYYLMQICPDGTVYPCCSQESAPIMGNCAEERLLDIWNGMRFNEFRMKMLEGAPNVGGVCSICKQYKSNMFPEDKIHLQDVGRLKEIYEQRKK